MIEITQQIDKLKCSIENSVAEYIDILNKIDALKGEIDNFLNKYLNSVGEYFKKTKFEYKNRVSELNSRKNYAQIIRNFHPDHSVNYANSFFPLIHKLHKQGHNKVINDIAQMLIPNNPTSKSNIIEELEYLERALDKIEQQKDDLKLRHHQMLNSKKYKLMQQAKWLKACGFDLTLETEKRLRESIAV